MYAINRMNAKVHTGFPLPSLASYIASDGLILRDMKDINTVNKQAGKICDSYISSQYSVYVHMDDCKTR